ncbi:MAG: NADPH-dependent 7-cyano-7-deazaguanine reductase QueF, partial [Deltaproteobacteria bacterium]|nr:NADPH-dependent 7-cyano-7-deazaguanine reductase QueF [Deltaproteobacteria bacterium]
THQPDWGSAFIHLGGPEVPTVASLMQYLVSFRGENHFHEEVCEMIYSRLWHRFAPESLAVTCVYTRRGGIDICPIRTSHPALMPMHLTTVSQLSQRLPRQ